MEHERRWCSFLCTGIFGNVSFYRRGNEYRRNCWFNSENKCFRGERKKMTRGNNKSNIMKEIVKARSVPFTNDSDVFLLLPLLSLYFFRHKQLVILIRFIYVKIYMYIEWGVKIKRRHHYATKARNKV